LIDGECADATLGATRPTREPLPAAAGCVRQGSVDDLYQLSIGSNWETERHDLRITHEGFRKNTPSEWLILRAFRRGEQVLRDSTATVIVTM
jgi:hypothetical protein